MRADEMVAKHGKSLIGKIITTQAYGEYPGGLATITELTPDPAAPEIPIQVMHSTFGSIGIFEHEEVDFYTGVDMSFTITARKGLVVAHWEGGRIAVVPYITHKESCVGNPIANGRLTAAKLADGTIIEGNPCHTDYRIPGELRLPPGLDPRDHYNYLQNLARQTTSLASEDRPDNHKGQIFNPYTERWSWI